MTKNNARPRLQDRTRLRLKLKRIPHPLQDNYEVQNLQGSGGSGAQKP